MSRTDDLIGQLCTRPRQSWHSYRRTALASALLALALSFLLQGSWLGIRADGAYQFSQPDFLAKISALSLLCGFTLRHLFATLRPGQRTAPANRLTLALLALFLLSAALPISRGDLGRLNPDALQCLLWIGLFGLVPFLIFARLARQSAPCHAPSASFAVALASWSCSALAYSLHCDSDLAFAPKTGNLTMLALYLGALPMLTGIAYLTRRWYTRW